MCASIALPKLLLLLSEPGRLYKVHLEFLTSLLWLSSHRQSYTWTKKIFFSFFFFLATYNFLLSLCPWFPHSFLFIRTIALYAVFPISFLIFCLWQHSDSKRIAVGYWHKNSCYILDKDWRLTTAFAHTHIASFYLGIYIHVSSFCCVCLFFVFI